MIKRNFKKLFSFSLKETQGGFKLYSYKKSNGEFDYDEYKRVQTEGNKRKINNRWVQKKEIEYLSKIITQYNPTPSFGICHGTRRGDEQKFFSQQLDCKVIGTEISDTAKQFPNTIEWDFHEVNTDWNKSADFVYSNSYDHSYDPSKSLNSWIQSLKQNGICIIEHTKNHTPEKVSKLDPFGFDLEAFPFFVLKWSKNKASVREIIKSPFVKQSGTIHYIIIQKN